MKFAVITNDKLAKINELMTRKIDDAYVTLFEKNGYRTIAQYSSVYDNVHIISVAAESLDKANKLDIEQFSC